MGLKVLAVSFQDILEHGARPSSLPRPGVVADSLWNLSRILGKNARGLVCTSSPGKPTLCHVYNIGQVPETSLLRTKDKAVWLSVGLCDFPKKRNIEDRLLLHTADATAPRQQRTSRIKPLQLRETRCELAQHWWWSATTAWPGLREKRPHAFFVWLFKWLLKNSLLPTSLRWVLTVFLAVDKSLG